MTINDDTARTGVTLVPKRGRPVDHMTIVHVFGGGTVRAKATSIFCREAKEGANPFGWEATLVMSVKALRKDFKLAEGERPESNEEAIKAALAALEK
jgi:hypothetical protein